MDDNDIGIREQLKILTSVIARIAFPEDKLRQIVSPNKSPKYIQAYNLCDGTGRTIAEIARTVDLDRGNLSKTISRWIAQGIVFQFGDDKDARYVHLYPIGLVSLPGKIKTNGEVPEDQATLTE